VVDSALPPVVNDSVLARLLLPVLSRVAGAASVVTLEPASVAEDFSYFANRVPGFYFRLGTRTPGGTSGGLHTPTYLGDDRAIPVGIRAMTELVLSYLTAAP
jgi:amidohydrolase